MQLEVCVCVGGRNDIYRDMWPNYNTRVGTSIVQPVNSSGKCRKIPAWQIVQKSLNRQILAFMDKSRLKTCEIKGQVPMPPGKKFAVYKAAHSAPPRRISLIRINPQPIRLPGIIIKLIRAVNQFFRQVKYRYILPINSQSDQLLGFEGYWRAV